MLTHSRYRPYYVPGFLLTVVATVALSLPIGADGRDDRGWPMIGHDVQNSRSQPDEHRVGPSQAGRLAPAWVLTSAGDVSATPAVSDDAVNFPGRAALEGGRANG